MSVAQNRFHTRQAAVALLKMAQATSDPKVAAGLVEAAAELKEQAGELPPLTSSRVPDIETEGLASFGSGSESGQTGTSSGL